MYGMADIVGAVDVVNQEGVNWTGSWFVDVDCIITALTARYLGVSVPCERIWLHEAYSNHRDDCRVTGSRNARR